MRWLPVSKRVHPHNNHNQKRSWGVFVYSIRANTTGIRVIAYWVAGGAVLKREPTAGALRKNARAEPGLEILFSACHHEKTKQMCGS